jgi:hypothetical protein
MRRRQLPVARQPHHERLLLEGRVGAGVGAALVGERGASHAAGTEGFEDGARARQQLGVVEPGLTPVLQDEREKALDIFRPGECGDGLLDAASDGGFDLRAGRLRQADRAHGVAMAAVDGAELVDERAVEVEEDRAEGHGPLDHGGWRTDRK